MEKSYTPVVIPSFIDGESMEEVRSRTINPLAAEANRLGSKVNELSLKQNEHTNKIAALEAGGGGGGGGSVDLSPILGRVSDLETESDNLDARLDIVETDQVTMKGQITALQNGGGGGSGGSSTFVGLTDTPSALVANNFLQVNAAGTAIEMKSPNFLTAESYVDSINVHGDFYIGPQGVYAKNEVAKASYLLAASGTSSTVNLPDIVSKTAMPTAEQVRSGRTLHIIGMQGNVTVNKPSASGQRIYYGGTYVDSIVVPNNGTLDLYALHNGSAFTHYIVIGGRNLP